MILVSPIWNSEPEVCGDGRRDTCTVIMLLKELKAVADEWGGELLKKEHNRTDSHHGILCASVSLSM